MKIFKEIREFFWPLLENDDIPNQNDKDTMLDKDDITVASSHLKETLEYAINCYEAESERRKTVESKSALFIGTISVVTSIIIGTTSVLVKISDFNITITFLVFLLFILTLYMTRSVWFSIKALERKNYHSISIDDFFINDTSDDYFKKLIAEITNKTKKNSHTINSIVDNMTMAQKYFKRAIIVVSIYAFSILLHCISKTCANFEGCLKKTIETINTITISGLNILLLYFISFTAIILSIIAMKKK
ncbi:MAG TPA: hypothetical protein GXZ40_07610 [Bacteroidales bacterium]|jgi:hypothetical protein|nr:hypothetical protein [Bacteroidales bacterium]